MRPIYTADLVLMPAEESLAGALCDYFRRNREFLTDYMPAWTESFFTERTQLESIRGHMENAKNRTGYRYYIMPKEEKGKIIGTIGLNNVVWGIFLSCFMGYMLDEAYKGGPLEILVAVLSCAWSYQMIGEHHQHVPGALEHPLYGEWVRGYCSKEYCETTQEIIDLVNELGKDISAEREAHLKEIFENCSRYEAMFWDMAYEEIPE